MAQQKLTTIVRIPSLNLEVTRVIDGSHLRSDKTGSFRIRRSFFRSFLNALRGVSEQPMFIRDKKGRIRSVVGTHHPKKSGKYRIIG